MSSVVIGCGETCWQAPFHAREERPLDVRAISGRVDRSVAAWGPTALRVTAALLWLANVSWKVPPDFGQVDGACFGLCGFVEAGVEHPLAPGTAWLFENLVGPNLAAFGWITLFVEASLAALLLSGRFLRVAAVAGMAQCLAILAAVANADGEWYWSYLLMIALHFAILVLAPVMRPTPVRVMAVVTVAYGVMVALAHAGAGFTGDGNLSWTAVFSAENDLPGDFLRNLFPGSVLLGLVLVLAGIAVWVVRPASDTRRSVIGWCLVGVSTALLLTYGTDGLILRLGSRATTVCLLAALGLALTVPTGRGPVDSVESVSVAEPA
jgi:thiosulfate dehydrogenase [quinone] large subunit